jgi:hypothetical protein
MLRTGTGLIVGAIVCLATVQFVFAQDVDPRCKDIYDKVACTSPFQSTTEGKA